MKKKEHTTRHTTDKELARLPQAGGSLSDWDKAASVSAVELEARIASDEDEAGMVIDWDNASIELPAPKAVLNMRVDREVLEFFRQSGKGYQSRINAVLRSYVHRQEHRRQQKA